MASSDTLLCLEECDDSLGGGGLGVGFEKQNYWAGVSVVSVVPSEENGKLVTHRMVRCNRLCLCQTFGGTSCLCLQVD